MAMKRGEVWWIEFDPAAGSEIRKPWLGIIVSNDSANPNLSCFIVVALTSNSERLYPGEALVTVDGTQSKAMADQIMTADKSRLKSQFGTLSSQDMQAVDEVMRV